MTSATSQISSQPSNSPSDPGRGLRIAALYLTSWFGAATAFGATGVIARLPRFAVPLLIWSALLGCIALYRRSGDVRAGLQRIHLALPLAFHAVVRTGYGIGILLEGERGGVPKLFAEVAGPGDVAVGLLALVALAFSARRTALARYLLLAWNWFALADIVVAVFLGQREILFGAGLSSFSAATHFPFAWLPTFVVPLIVATHLWMFARLRRFE